MAFAIKAEIRNPRAKVFVFDAQKTMSSAPPLPNDDAGERLLRSDSDCHSYT